MGRARRATLSASRARVSSFSLASSVFLALSHSPRVTMVGWSISASLRMSFALSTNGDVQNGQLGLDLPARASPGPLRRADARGADELADQVPAFGVGGGKLNGGPVGVGCFVVSTEPTQQVGACCGKEVVAGQGAGGLQMVDEGQAGGRPVGHAHGHRPIEALEFQFWT